MKLIKLKVSRDKLITHTITIFSGYYKLTDLEQKLIAEIVKHYLDLKSKTKDEDLFNTNFLSASAKATIMEELSIKPPQFTHYLNSLKEKKVIKEEDKLYFLESKFIPDTTIQFEFLITEK